MNKNVTQASKVMRLNIGTNSVFITQANYNDKPKAASHPEAATVSNTVTNQDQNFNKIQNTILNSKENITDSCFKGDNLQQLSTNALPPYVSASPTNVIKADATSYEFHCCTDCGDTFALKCSLKFHLERRSVLIKFPCDACKSIQLFYNRCTLLSHIRTHTDKSETSDITKAIVNPLPRIFMDGLQTECVNTLDDELTSIEDNITPAADLLEFSLNVEDNDNAAQSNLTEEENISAKVKCLDCNEEFKNSKERAQHLTQNDKIPEVVHQCNKCNMVCPSKCFLKAHQRIHLQISPYVCPECGESPSPLWLNFQFHVKYKCFHNTRTIGYKCPICKRLASSNDSLLKHMELHTEKYYKCDSCPRAYLNIPSFSNHVMLYHPPKPGKVVRYNLIYKCSLCDIVFLTHDQMLDHRPVHLREKICEYVFNCMQCGKPLESKSELLDHIKSNHPKILKHIEDLSEPESKPNEITQKTYTGTVECMLCNTTCHSSLGYVAHLSRIHSNFNQPCAYCFMILKCRKEMISHGKKHLSKGCYLCLLCNNKKWNEEKQLDLHVLKHVENIKYCTFCPVCNEILKTRSEAAKHLREEHRLFHNMGTQPNISQSIEIVTCHFCRDSFVDEKELQDHLKVKHQVETIKPPSPNLNEDHENEDSSKTARMEGNICAKCNYHSLEREDFKKHILSHKTNRSTFQCQECGLCFVVEPALVKHLRVIHKISDTKKYIEEEGTNCMPDFESYAEVSACNSLICSVCFTTFSNETTLKTHMRSHGMAFIQAAKSTSNIS